MKRVRSTDDQQGSSTTYPSPPTSGRLEGFHTNAFQAEKWVSFLADNEPCLFTAFSSSRCFLKKSKGGGQLHHHTNSHLVQSVKYVCGKHLKCMLAIQQTRTVQLEKSRVITILVTVILLSQITGPSPLAPGPESTCILLYCKFSSPDSLIRRE